MSLCIFLINIFKHLNVYLFIYLVQKNTSYVSSILYKNRLQKYIFLCSFFLRCFHFGACFWTAEHWVTVLRVIPTCTVTCYTRFLPINFIPPPRVHILYIETNEYHKLVNMVNGVLSIVVILILLS